MRILLVEDECLIREVLTRRLRARGVEVDPAIGVREALELLDQRAYELVISDENMPDGFGHALLETIASRQPACRRVLMSGLEAPANVSVVWERFFTKPGDVEELVRWSVTQLEGGDG